VRTYPGGQAPAGRRGGGGHGGHAHGLQIHWLRQEGTSRVAGLVADGGGLEGSRSCRGGGRVGDWADGHWLDGGGSHARLAAGGSSRSGG
jgi:hypothetical protein